MILPKKHLSIEESLFGFGAFLLQKITTPTSIENLWGFYKDAYVNKQYAVKFSFDDFVIALDYLYIIGAIKINEGGLVCCEID